MIAAYFSLFGFAIAVTLIVRGERRHRAMRQGLSGYDCLQPGMIGRFVLSVMCIVTATMAGFLLAGGWGQDGAFIRNLGALITALACAIWAHDFHDQLYERVVAWSMDSILLRDAGGEARVDMSDLVAIRAPALSTSVTLSFSGDRELEFERYLANSGDLLSLANRRHPEPSLRGEG